MVTISKMLKCRALFLESIAALNNNFLLFDDNLNSYLEGFYESYKDTYFADFNLIFYFEMEDDKPVIREKAEWGPILLRYLSWFQEGNIKEIKKLYDDIGFKDTQRVSNLAELFCEYIMEICNYNILSLKC